MTFGISFGLIFGVRGSYQSLTNDIRTVEALRWSWKRLVTGVIIGLAIGLSYRLVIGFSSGLNLINAGIDQGLFLSLQDGFWSGLRFGIVTGPIGGLLGGQSNQPGSIGHVVAEILSDEGYRVESRHYRSRAGTYGRPEVSLQLLLTPAHSNSPALIEQLKPNSPGLKVIFLIDELAEWIVFLALLVQHRPYFRG